MANLVLYYTSGGAQTLTLTRDRVTETSAIRRYFENREGVEIKLGDENFDPSILTIQFNVSATAASGVWSAWDTFVTACENITSIDIEGNNRTLYGVQRIRKIYSTLHFAATVDFIAQTVYPIAAENPEVTESTGLLLADGVIMQLADGELALEA